MEANTIMKQTDAKLASTTDWLVESGGLVVFPIERKGKSISPLWLDIIIQKEQSQNDKKKR